MQAPSNIDDTSLSILLVDDSASERRLLGALLQTLGHQVVEAGDGREAVTRLRRVEHPFDLILLDVQMPQMNGYETARAIRALEQQQTACWSPIIFLSGKSTPDDIAQGIDSGGDDYLIKPVNGLILKSKIKAMQRIAGMRQQLVSLTQRLDRLAHMDELTELPNRRYFNSILDREIARARRYRSPLSVAYLDIDLFKRVNDNYGHDMGDQVLKAVAREVDNNLRAEDRIGRLGGEEFCICLPGSTLLNAFDACERYRQLLQALVIQHGENSVTVTASFGLTEFDPDSDNRDSVLARADSALYHAKSAGRNQVQSLLLQR